MRRSACTASRLRRDSGGAGAQRGGLGIIREYEILHGEVRFTHRGERHFIAPKGRAGGHDGAMARTVIHRAERRRGDGALQDRDHAAAPATASCSRPRAAAATAIRPAATREQVRLDLADGKISPEGAEIYDQGPSGRALTRLRGFSLMVVALAACGPGTLVQIRKHMLTRGVQR